MSRMLTAKSTPLTFRTTPFAVSTSYHVRQHNRIPCRCNYRDSPGMTPYEDDSHHEDVSTILPAGIKERMEKLYRMPTLSPDELTEAMMRRWGRKFHVEFGHDPSNVNGYVFTIKWEHDGHENFPFKSLEDYRTYLSDICYMVTMRGLAVQLSVAIAQSKETPYAMMGHNKRNITFRL